MRKNDQLIESRNTTINVQYSELSRLGFSHRIILIILSSNFFLSERTIYGIVSGEFERRKKKGNMKNEYPKPHVFKPTREDVENALKNLSKYLSTNSVISSSDFPDLKVAGQRPAEEQTKHTGQDEL